MERKVKYEEQRAADMKQDGDKLKEQGLKQKVPPMCMHGVDASCCRMRMRGMLRKRIVVDALEMPLRVLFSSSLALVC